MLEMGLSVVRFVELELLYLKFGFNKKNCGVMLFLILIQV